MPMKSYDDGTIAHLDHAAGDEIALGQRVLVLAKKGEDPKEVAESAGLGGTKARRRPAKRKAAAAPAAERRAAAAPASGRTAASADDGRQPTQRPRPRRRRPGQVEPAGPQDRGGGQRRPRPGQRHRPRRPGHPPRRRGVPRRRSRSRRASRRRPPAARGRGRRRRLEPAPAGRRAHPAHADAQDDRPADGRRPSRPPPRSTSPSTSASTSSSPSASELNKQLAAEKIKLSLGDFVTKAVALALRCHPGVNASFEPDAIVRHGEVNVGIAVALDERPDRPGPAQRRQPRPARDPRPERGARRRRPGQHADARADDRRHVHDLATSACTASSSSTRS